MEILAIMIYVINGLFGVFAFNQAKTEQQKQLIPHGIIWILIAFITVLLFLNDYFYHAILVTVVTGLPIIFTNGSTPDFLFRDTKRFNIAIGISLIVDIIFYIIMLR